MLKFFRKYNTIILVFGGVFLMIAFLLPQAIQQFSPNFANRKLFKAGEITYGTEEVNEAGRENLVVANTFDPLFGLREYHRLALGIESTDHYLMLAQLAKEMGLYNPGANPEEMLPRLLTQFGGQVPTESQLTQLNQTYDAAVVEVRDPELAARALRRIDSIIRLRELYALSSTFSEQELSLYSTRLFNSVDATVGFLPGERFAETLEPLTEQDFVEQYERFKNDFPEDNAYGFSYRLEDAAKFELLLIDRDLIAEGVTLDPIEVRKHHRLNREARGWSEDFRAARAQVERDLRNEKVDEILDAVTGAVDNALVNATAPLVRGDDGKRILPEDWASRRPTFESLASIANEAADALIASPEPVARVLRFDDAWYTREDIRTATELSTLGIVVQGRRAPLSTAIMLFPEFEPANAMPEAQVGLAIGGIVDAPTGRSSGAGYIRVLDTRKEGPSSSIEEVRAEVERDARALHGYEALLARKDEIRAAALDEQLLAGYVYELQDEGPEVSVGATIKYYDVQFRSPAPVFFAGPGSREMASALNNEEFARRVIEPTTQYDPTVQTAAIPTEDRFFAIEVPRSQALTLVFVTRHAPLPLEQLQRVSSVASSYVSERVLAENPDAFLRASLDRRSVAERLGFVAFDDTYALDATDQSDEAGADQG